MKGGHTANGAWAGASAPANGTATGAATGAAWGDKKTEAVSGGSEEREQEARPTFAELVRRNSVEERKTIRGGFSHATTAKGTNDTKNNINDPKNNNSMFAR